MRKRFSPIRSKQEGFKRAKRYHFCLDCRHSQHEKFDKCPNCDSKNRQYFMSEREMKRGALLLTMQDAGKISKLRFQPRFPLKVNNQVLGHYVSDADYYNESGEYIVEDTKPDKWMDSFAKWKIRHFQLQYCTTVTIPQRKKGTL